MISYHTNRPKQHHSLSERLHRPLRQSLPLLSILIQNKDRRYEHEKHKAFEYVLTEADHVVNV